MKKWFFSTRAAAIYAEDKRRSVNLATPKDFAAHSWRGRTPDVHPLTQPPPRFRVKEKKPAAFDSVCFGFQASFSQPIIPTAD